MPRKQPLPERELSICRRVFEARQAFGISLRFAAQTLDINEGVLKRVELGRAPLKYAQAVPIVNKYALNARWLYSGEGLRHSGLKIPEPEAIGVAEDALFSRVFEEWGGKTELPPLDTALDYSRRRNESLRAVWQIEDWLDQLSDSQLKPFTDELLKAGHQLFTTRRSDEWPKVLKRWESRHGNYASNPQPLLLPKDFPKNEKFKVDESLRSVNNAGVTTLAKLLAKVRLATSQRGKKSELAKYLGVPLASVSQWLSGDREPGGETTLRLLHWVQQQEQK